MVMRFSVHRSIEAMRLARKAIDPAATIGFIPTMGALHEGHLSLMRRAAAENDVVVASIFVNPTQFAPDEDLGKYPRTWERDIALLQEAGSIDILFAPTRMYGKNHIMYVDPGGSYFDNLPEALVRPGHFRGVATIVTKLLNIVQPHNIYFGQKDAAQCFLVRRLVNDLSIDTNVVIGQTIREPDGLAMSSRNTYLSSDQRLVASVLYRSLLAAKILYESYIEDKKSKKSKETLTILELRNAVKSVLEKETHVKVIEYIAIDQYDNMRPLNDEQSIPLGEDIIVSLACQVGKTRLIDNMVLSFSRP